MHRRRGRQCTSRKAWVSNLDLTAGGVAGLMDDASFILDGGAEMGSASGKDSHQVKYELWTSS